MSTMLGERDKCLKCKQPNEVLLASYDCLSYLGFCFHIFCISCFTNENANKNKIKCPCCHEQYYEYIQSISEGILIGEAAYLNHKAKLLNNNVDNDQLRIHTIRNQAIEKFEQALLLSRNIITMKCIVHSCQYGLEYCSIVEDGIKPAQYPLLYPIMHINSSERYNYRQRIYECCLDLIENAFDSNGLSLIHSYRDYRGQQFTDTVHVYYSTLLSIFNQNGNIHAMLKYAQLAYDTCLHSSDHSDLARYKYELDLVKESYAKEPPLRFAVGDEVEYLVEEGDTSVWKLAKVIELYYRERNFPLVFTAPYRLQLLEGSTDSSDQAIVYACVKADLDRYIRKVGVRAVEDTRYQARLEAKVAELVQVHCSKEFIKGIYNTLIQDREFIETLKVEWRINFSGMTLLLYRMLVMYRQPLIRTDSGYHIPTAEEVIAGIRAFFDPKDLALAAPSAASDTRITQARRAKAVTIAMLQDGSTFALQAAQVFEIECTEAMYLRAFGSYPILYFDGTHLVDMLALIGDGFTVPLPAQCISSEVSDALSTVAGIGRLESMISDPRYAPASRFLILWKNFVKFLDKAGTGPACECPLIYFFVRYSLGQGVGVPKPALAVYDRMNMQLSREFIRCANPSCELNKLDQSDGQVKFKKCSRCQAVIYCSKECQVAHYPLHKKLCLAHSG